MWVEHGSLLSAEEVPVPAVVGLVAALRARLPGVAFGIDRDGDSLGEPATHAALPGGFVLPAPVADVVDHLDALHRLVVAAAPPGVTVGFSGLPMIEAVSAETDKGKSLARLCTDLCVAATDVVAFGDQRSDIAMFTFAGLALATENAHPEARRAADAVIGHHDDDAVARWIEALLSADGRTA